MYDKYDLSYMTKEPKTITIDCKLCKKIEEHNKSNGSCFSSVIDIALRQFFKMPKENKQSTTKK